jgi:hypothetical protein
MNNSRIAISRKYLPFVISFPPQMKFRILLHQALC